jgi:ISXO2-like transposase domain
LYLKGKIFDVNLINFIEQFPDKTFCKLKFKEIRDTEWVICRKCGSKDHYWQKSILQFQCKKCKTRTTLRSGTVMQASKFPFQYWFIAIHLLTSTKKTFSALEMQKQLGHKYYEPVWYMVQKLRKTMGRRDRSYKLNKFVELDEGFFESVDTESPTSKKSQKQKRGQDTQRQTKVIVMASSVHTLSPPEKHRKQSKFRFVRMIVADDLKSDTIDRTITENIAKNSLVKTDNYRGYSNIKKLV